MSTRKATQIGFIPKKKKAKSDASEKPAEKRKQDETNVQGEKA